MDPGLTKTDTIAAVATPAGRGGIGVIRLSGPHVATIGQEILGDLPPPRQAALRVFRDAQGDMLDGGLVLYFPAPASFTGEDVLELHGHGGPVVMDMLLARTLELGARHAQPGEFSQRAFLNDKLDLAQAEAIADLIDSASVEGARAALRSLQGDFSVSVRSLTDAVTETRMYVEGAIDFPEEEVDFLGDQALRERIAKALELCTEITAKARQGSLLREGMTVVIAGRPNAGKSSLLNRLAGYDAAIVTAIPGTTRDILRERIHIDGLPLHIADTAGLRDEADVVETEGIRRAHHEMARADRILYVIDATRLLDDEAMRAEIGSLPAEIPVTLVINKIDAVNARPSFRAISADADPPVRQHWRGSRSSARTPERVRRLSGRGRRHDLGATSSSRCARASGHAPAGGRKAIERARGRIGGGRIASGAAVSVGDHRRVHLR